MVQCSTSLWSADLSSLAADIKRVEPYSERFHLDVADGHYVPSLLFFPDLVKALRKHTAKPFEVHLMVTDPLAWLEPFAEAGADSLIVQYDAVKDVAEAVRAISALGKRAGVALRIEEPVEVLAPYWEMLDTVVVIGTALGIKGASMDAGVPDKIKAAKTLSQTRGLSAEVEADGGIRRNTVPLMARAGVDLIVPGSLMFGEDPKAMREWLAGLG